MEINYRTEFPELLKVLGLQGDAAEIGVAEGRNAEVLIKAPVIENLYLIDNWATLEQPGDGGYDQAWHDNNLKEVHERIGPWKEKAILLRGLSRKMIKEIPDDSLIFAYVDCDHSFSGCYSDLMNIYPKVKIGGVIAGHDFLNPAYGVNRAVSEFTEERGYLWSDIHTTKEDGDTSMVSFWFVKK